MKKVSIIFVLFLLLGIGAASVKADTSCTVTQKSELMTLASKLSFTYEINESDDPDATDYFDVKIYNLNTQLKITATNESNNKNYFITYRNIGEDGSVTIQRPIYSKVTNYKFVVYGTESCQTTSLRTFRLTLPRANYLAGIEKCQDIQDFYLCKPYVTFEINDETAIRAIDDYIKKKESQEEKEEKESGNTGVISKTLTGISNNKLYFALAVIAIGVIATVLVLRKRKSDK